MKLITVQPQIIVDQLARGELVYANPDFDLDADDLQQRQRKAYDWMVQQMAQRLGPLTFPSTWPPSEHRGGTSKVLCYPMWFWVVPPQDVDAFLPIQTEPGDTILHLEVPDSLVLCHDYDMWHHVLNMFPVRLYEDEAINKEESWQRIFGVDPVRYCYTLDSPDREYMALDSPPTLHATTWYIDPQWITKSEPHQGTT